MLGMRLKEESVINMALRKMGTCKDCGGALYGDDYGPGGGHDCPKRKMLHDDIGDLVRFKNNLRWRKWPEEKPEPSTGCIGIIDINPPAYILCRYQDGQFIFPASMQYEISYWLPLTALPEIESIK